MDDETPDPVATMTPDASPVTSAWPPPEEWPADDASAREMAAFYRDRLGLTVLPSPGPADVMAHAMKLWRDAVADWADEHPDEPVPDETWDDAREIAAKYRKGPIPYIRREKFVTAADVTDAHLDLWFVADPNARGPRKHADERGIVVLAGRSSRGFPLLLVDTDPRHGGDLGGEWANLPGPRASTPGLAYGDPVDERRPGVHCLVLASSSGRERSSQGHLAPGVDVVAGGGTPIPLPAGAATPHRRWLCRDAPREAPAALREQPRRRAPPRPGMNADGTPAAPDARRGIVRADRGPGDDDEEFGLGRAANIIASEAGVGERNPGAAAIVGILARPLACPPDFVRACLEMLAEEFAGRDGAGAAELERESAEWRRLLTRGPRDADFAADVVATWIRCRDVNPRRWKDGHARKTARSIWRALDRREGGQAGAEDFGVGGMLGHRPAGWPAATRVCLADVPQSDEPADAGAAAGAAAETPQVTHAAPAEAPQAGVGADASPPIADAVVDVFNPPTPAAAVQAPAWRGGIDPATYTRSLAEFYPPDRLERDMQRRPVRVDDVMPMMDFATGRYFTPEERPGYGWGAPLDLAIGGFSPGDVRFIGAAGAGAGKTWFECFLSNGLTLATACRILGYEGFGHRPIVMPVWVTEMPKRGELTWRLCGQFFGFDLAALAWGQDADRAPGVVAHARELAADLRAPWTPVDVVRRARAHVAHHLERPGSRDDSPLGFAWHRLIKVISLSSLPAPRGRSGPASVDHRAGPTLVDHVADAVAHERCLLADLLAVAESDVLPLVMVDPGQRFAGAGREARAMIDDFFGAVVSVLAGELECAVLGTLDTTKHAAREIGVDAFLGGDAPALAADMAAGSQAIMHNADVIGLCAERVAPGAADPLRTTQWCRLLKGRTGNAAEAYPFDWEMSRGRYRARPAEPLRARQDGDGAPGPGGGRDRDGGRPGDRRGGRQPAPPDGAPIGHRPPAKVYHPGPTDRRLRAGETHD